jgi:hypothetical protein
MWIFPCSYNNLSSSDNFRVGRFVGRFIGHSCPAAVVSVPLETVAGALRKPMKYWRQRLYQQDSASAQHAGFHDEQ